MRRLLPLLFLAAGLGPAPAEGRVRIVSAAPAGPVVAGQTVDVVVVTDAPADEARLTFPNLRGVFGETLCGLHRSPGTTRFVLPYRPAHEGVHDLQLRVTSGACGLRRRSDERVVRLFAARPLREPAVPAAPPAACRGADEPPVPRTMRSSRLAVHCLLDAARASAGLRGLYPNRRLRRLASLAAHRGPGHPGRPGEQRTVTPESTPAEVVRAWLASEAHRRDLLDPSARRVGISVVPRYPGPLKRPETTYVVELGLGSR